LNLDDAITLILSGGAVGTADDVVVTAGAGGAERLSVCLSESSLGRDALRGEGGFNGGRFKRVMSLVGRIAWSGWQDALSTYLRSPRGVVRRIVAKSLVKRGDEAGGRLLALLLAKEDDEAAAGALEGVVAALKDHRAVEEFRRIAFEAIVTEWVSKESGKRFPVFNSPPEILYVLDPSRAAAFLTSAEALRSDNPGLSDVLDAIEKFELKVDLKTLLELLPKLKYPRSVLRYLARHDPQSGKIVRGFLEHGEFSVRTETFDILLGLRGINLFELTAKQRRDPTLSALHTVHQILGNLESDGLPMAMENVDRRKWPAAIGLLKQAGATEMAACFEEALDRAPRTDQDVAEAIEGRIFEDAERVHPKLYSFMEKLGNRK